MKILLSVICLLLLTSCGPSPQEKEEIAVVTCNIMGESRNMESATRIKEINAAREKIGEDLFLGSDYEIRNSFKYGLCKELVLNDDYDSKLATARELEMATIEAERLRKEKIAQAEREADKKVEQAARKLGISDRIIEYMASYGPKYIQCRKIMLKVLGYEFGDMSTKKTLELYVALEQFEWPNSLYEAALEIDDGIRQKCGHFLRRE
jgi:hypothetical protein